MTFQERFFDLLARLGWEVGKSDGAIPHPSGWEVMHSGMYQDDFPHPPTFQAMECAFASEHVHRAAPKTILDVGSYRYFVSGLAASPGFNVTFLDVRDRRDAAPAEKALICDAKKIKAKTASFDCVTSLCSIEHFGLGRYGDEFDLEGDVKGVKEMRRVLKPGGALIITTTLSAFEKPVIFFNAHRVYNYPTLSKMFQGMERIEERCWSLEEEDWVGMEQANPNPGGLSVYMGAWRKMK